LAVIEDCDFVENAGGFELFIAAVAVDGAGENADGAAVAEFVFEGAPGAAVEAPVGEGSGQEGVERVVFAPVFARGWGGGGPRLMDGPKGALVLGVVAEGEAVALGEGGGSGVDSHQVSRATRKLMSTATAECVSAPTEM
jgi:hypothetical protein